MKSLLGTPIVKKTKKLEALTQDPFEEFGSKRRYLTLKVSLLGTPIVMKTKKLEALTQDPGEEFRSK